MKNGTDWHPGDGRPAMVRTTTGEYRTPRSKRTPKTTRLNAEELRQFAVVQRYVRKMCGVATDAEVLRFLVRDWEPK
jgi:hypothetical protein